MVADAIFKFFEAVAKLQNFWFAELTGQFFFKFLNLQSKKIPLIQKIHTLIHSIYSTHEFPLEKPKC